MSVILYCGSHGRLFYRGSWWIVSLLPASLLGTGIQKKEIQMATKEVTVLVSKEAHELGEGLVGMAVAVKAALADGWQTGTDLPLVISAALTTLVPAVQGAELIPAEAGENPAAFAKAVALAVADGYEALKPTVPSA